MLGRPLNSRPGEKSRFYGYNDEQCSVEELALQYYKGLEGGDTTESGWDGLHSESGVTRIIMSLCTPIVMIPKPANPLFVGLDYFVWVAVLGCNLLARA